MCACMRLCVVPFLSLQASPEDLNDDLLFLRLATACVFCSLFPIEYPKAHPTGNDAQIADKHTHTRSHTHTHMIHTHKHSHSHLKRKQSKWISLLISLLLDGTLL